MNSILRYFEDPRHRGNRLLLAVLLPISAAALIGLAAVLYEQEQNLHRRVIDESGETSLRLSLARTELAPEVDAAEAQAYRPLIDKALLAFRSGDLDGTKRHLSGVDLNLAASSEAWMLAGLIQEAEGDIRSASDIYSRGIASTPSGGLFYSRALLHRANGELAPALEDLEKAADLSPSDILIRNDRLLLLLQMRQIDRVESELGRLAANPGMQDRRSRIFAMAGMAMEKGDWDKGASLVADARALVSPEVFDHLMHDPAILKHRARPELASFFIHSDGRGRLGSPASRVGRLE